MATPAGDQFSAKDDLVLVRLVERQGLHQPITNFTFLSRQFRKIATVKGDLLDLQTPRFYTASRCSSAYHRLLRSIDQAASDGLTSSGGVRKSGGRKGPSVADLLINEALPVIAAQHLHDLRQAIADKQQALHELCDLIHDVESGACNELLLTMWKDAVAARAAAAAAAAAEAAAVETAQPGSASPQAVSSSGSMTPPPASMPPRPDTRLKKKQQTPDVTASPGRKVRGALLRSTPGSDEQQSDGEQQSARGALSASSSSTSLSSLSTPSPARPRSLRSSSSSGNLAGELAASAVPPVMTGAAASRSSSRLSTGAASPVAAAPRASVKKEQEKATDAVEAPRRRGRPPKRSRPERDDAGESPARSRRGGDEDDVEEESARAHAVRDEDGATGDSAVVEENNNDEQEDSDDDSDDDSGSYKRQRAAGARKQPTPATEEQIASLKRVWRALWAFRDAVVFRYPVTKDEAPDYDEMVKHRMDLSTIRKKIEAPDGYSVIEFYRDFMLMIQNALMYNSVDSEVYTMALSLKRFGKKEFAQLLPLCDPAEAPLVLRSQSGSARLTRSTFH